MANDADNLVVGANGRVLVAAVGTTAPTDVATAYAAGWAELGYISEDGFTWNNTKTIEDVPAWQEHYPIRRIVTARSAALSFSIMEWTLAGMEFAFEGNITEPSAGVFKLEPPDPEDLDERALSVEWQDDTEIYRLTFPRGIVIGDVEVTFSRSAPALLPVEFSALGTAGVKPWTLLSNNDAMDPGA